MINNIEKDKQIFENSSEKINNGDSNTINTLNNFFQKQELTSNLNNINPYLNKNNNNIYKSYNVYDTTIGKQNKNNQQFIIENCFHYSYNGRILNDLKSFYTNENKEITNIKNNNIESNNNHFPKNNSQAIVLPVNIIQRDKTSNIDGKINNLLEKEYYKDDCCKICCEKFWKVMRNISIVILLILLNLYGLLLIILLIFSLITCNCQQILDYFERCFDYIKKVSKFDDSCRCCDCSERCYNLCSKCCKFKK